MKRLVLAGALVAVVLVLGGASCGPLPQPPQENNTFLCYSKFEQDSGKVFDVKAFQTLLGQGYYQPSAIKGTAPSDAYTTAGKYYLACNPPASMKPTGFGVDLDGLDIYPLPTYSFAATVFPIVQ